MFESIGLRSDAARLYRAILDNPKYGVDQLGELLGWSPEQVRGVLDELAELSLVRPSWEQPETLLAVNPAVGFSSLLAREEQELLRRQQELAANRRAVMELIEQHSRQRHLHHPEVEHLAGLDEVRLRIEELAAACEAELMAFAPRGAQSREAMEASRPLDQAILRRGVLVRTVYVQSIYNDSLTLEYAQWLSEAGALVRTYGALSQRLLIYDREAALVPVDPDEESSGALLVRGTGIVNALCEHFEAVWDKSAELSLSHPRRRGGDDLTPQQMAVLRLLADGHTDETIARRLGVSLRTTRRITAELMQMLGARSRFQAGVRAVERGILRSESDRPDEDEQAAETSPSGTRGRPLGPGASPSPGVT
ncbi:helix-turn-helix domain-containing protein [Actinomadura litoris]|uniref:LuxR family transcriptional regulator n=1 Tax=Actinomadura litoris TaxID=2678616 RepID=A0A7K1KXK6_9ACTN|nr:helix-turn-helix transcriptional regulator [Actinomadura litoris]MUN36793.1 LuxR family transcriptional regulator [Actinomadura litoris]